MSIFDHDQNGEPLSHKDMVTNTKIMWAMIVVLIIIVISLV